MRGFCVLRPVPKTDFRRTFAQDACAARRQKMEFDAPKKRPPIAFGYRVKKCVLRNQAFWSQSAPAPCRILFESVFPISLFDAFCAPQRCFVYFDARRSKAPLVSVKHVFCVSSWVCVLLIFFSKSVPQNC